jgi:hypothetical protein
MSASPQLFNLASNVKQVGPIEPPRSTALQSASAPLLPLLWFSQLKEVAHQDYLVKNLFLAASLNVVFGRTNSGKTFWLLDLGLTIAAGIPWQDRRTRKGLVLYVAGEGARSVQTRVAAYRAQNPQVADGLPFAIIPLAVDFMDKASVMQLIATVRHAEETSGQKVGMLIVDTLARAIPGANENDAQDIGVAVANADQIRMQLGCAVTFVHHCGKDAGKGSRGSTALPAAVDTEILIEGQSGRRLATVTKQRDLDRGVPLPFELKVVKAGVDVDGDPITSCVVKHLDASARSSAPELPRGKVQQGLITALRAEIQGHLERIFNLAELLEIGRKVTPSRSSAHSAVHALIRTPYLHEVSGGYKFVDWNSH